MFLSVVTRCHPNRPKYFADNAASLARQTCRDFEHVIIQDSVGRGVGWANAQLQHANPKGDYVMVLDDDDYLTCPGAIETLKEATAERPEIVLFKVDHKGLGILPSAKVWKKKPVGGHIGSCDFIVRRDVWNQHIAAFAQPMNGDIAFLRSLWRDGIDAVWLDSQLAAVQRISRGRGEND